MAAKQLGVARRVAASPLAKKLALEKGIDLSSLIGQGSGPGGRIRAQDIKGGIIGGGPRTLGQAVTLDRARQELAKRFSLSKQTVPHYYLTVQIEVDTLLGLRSQFNELLSKDKVNISVNDFIIKAAALACLKVPEANSSWQTNFIRQYSSVDINVILNTENGLKGPIIYQAERKGIQEISNQLKKLALKARKGELQSNELEGGTFTITNLGMFNVRRFIPIVYPPQACTLSIGKTERRLVPRKGAPNQPANFIQVTLACDHRVVDGAVGAQWLQWFRQFLEKPFTMIL